MNTDLTKTEGTEQKQVEKRTSIGAHIVLEAVRHEGEEELGRSSSALAWSASLTDYALRFAIPTLIGNIIGGVSLVAALNHAQVVAGKNEESDRDRHEKSASVGRRVARRAG